MQYKLAVVRAFTGITETEKKFHPAVIQDVGSRKDSVNSEESAGASRASLVISGTWTVP